MSRTYCLALGCLLLFSLSDSVAIAEQANDEVIRQHLEKMVDVGSEYDGFRQYIQRLSEAIELPIDLEQRELQLEGFTFSSSRRILGGAHPAKDWLDLILIKFDFLRDRMSFLVTEDPNRRSSLGLRVLITTRAHIRQLSLIVPPAYPDQAERIVSERLMHRMKLSGGHDSLTSQLKVISETIKLPIDIDGGLLKDEEFQTTKYEVTAGELTALERLKRLLEKAGTRRSLSYTVAYDDRRRLASGVRLVVAARSTIENNPARFSSPRRWPVVTHVDVDRVLRRPITLELRETPLHQAIRTLADQAKVSIWLDEDAIWKEGLTPQKVVTVKVRDQPLDAILKKMLEDADGKTDALVFICWPLPIEGARLDVTSRTVSERNHWELPSIYRKLTKQ